MAVITSDKQHAYTQMSNFAAPAAGQIDVDVELLENSRCSVRTILKSGAYVTGI